MPVSKGKSKSKDSDNKKKKKKEEKEPRRTRKSFILEQVQEAGKQGIKVDELVELTNEEFDYAEGKTSRMRVNNTLKQAVEDGNVEIEEGVAVWVG